MPDDRTDQKKKKNVTNFMCLYKKTKDSNANRPQIVIPTTHTNQRIQIYKKNVHTKIARESVDQGKPEDKMIKVH